MKDDERSPVQHQVVLHRIDPEQGIQRFYSLMIERDPLGTVCLVRNWVRLNQLGSGFHTASVGIVQDAVNLRHMLWRERHLTGSHQMPVSRYP